jgi:hypothetical protein
MDRRAFIGTVAGALLAAPLAAEAQRAAITRNGQLGGADYIMQAPENWRGGLVVLAHGIQRGPGRGDLRMLPIASHVLAEGHAWIASGYGHVIVLWDRGSIHKGPDVRALLTRCPRLHVEPFPGYAPDLNPDEFVWTHFKATLANGRSDNLDELMAALCRITKKARKRPALLRSFITASERPAFL